MISLTLSINQRIVSTCQNFILYIFNNVHGLIFSYWVWRQLKKYSTANIACANNAVLWQHMFCSVQFFKLCFSQKKDEVYFDLMLLVSFLWSSCCTGACCLNMLFHSQATRQQKVLAWYCLSCPSPRGSWVDIVMLELNNLSPLLVVLINYLNHYFDLDWYLNLDCYLDWYLNLVILITINLLDWSAQSFLDQLLWSNEIMFSLL